MMKTALLFLALLLSSCTSHRHSSMRRDCASTDGCSASTPIVRLSVEEESAAIQRARDEVSRDVGREVITPAPRVVYVACPFLVEHTTLGENVCAAGVTEVRGQYIKVATFERWRIAELVYWEARNYFWKLNGLGEKAI